jgi:hypothetical protein
MKTTSRGVLSKQANRERLRSIIRFLDVTAEQLDETIQGIPSLSLASAKLDLKRAKSNLVDYMEETE